MKKDIKDFLHLYLGCEIVNAAKNGRPIKLTAEFLSGMGEDEYGNDWEMFKPLLRPLSDMTEDEEDFIQGEWGNPLGTGLADALRCGEKYLKPVNESVELFRYLLSKHFDLFGLIDAGLAIDKSKMEKQ